MRLKSFGCSFIFGTDLSDDNRHGAWATASKLTWPALIAQQLGLDYQCNAKGGAGNLQIMDRVLTHAAMDSSDVFIIGWTWIDRFDYSDPLGWQHSGRSGNDWCTLSPITTGDVAKVYYRDLHSEYRDKITSLAAINTVIDVLERNRQKFAMTCMDYLMFDDRHHSSPGMHLLQQRIRPYMWDFQGQSFLDWSRSQGFEISDTLHPLEPAHAAGAALMLPRVRSLIA